MRIRSSCVPLCICVLLAILSLACAQFSSILRVNDVEASLDSTTVEKALRSKSAGKPADQVSVLVQLAPGSNLESIETAAGATLGSYLGDNVYIVNARADAINLIQQREDVTAVGQYKAQHKYISKNFDDLYLGAFKKRQNQLLGVNNVEINLAKLGIDITTEPRIRAQLSEAPVLVDVLLEPSVALENRRQHKSETHLNQELTVLRSALQQQGIPAEIVRASNAKMTLRVAVKHAKRAAETLASLNGVHWVEPRPTLTTFNREARWVTQSNSKTKGSIMNENGITGRDQIVAIGDTGIDYYGCYFYDPESPNVTLSRSPDDYVPSNHRTIAGYWAFMDGLDSEGGHGTHVAGSVLGNAVHDNTALSEFNGMAPNARAFVTDIGCSQSGGCTCGGVPCECDVMGGSCYASDRAVWLPLDLNEYYFPFAYSAGARIHTNSWGGGADQGYTIMTREIDTFAWEHKDFLILFAAGNAGSDYGYISISSQAEAKNALTVGASMSSIDTFITAQESLVDYDDLAKTYGEFLATYMGCDIDRSDPCAKNLPDLEYCWFLGNFTSAEDCCSKTSSYCAGGGCGCAHFGLGDICCKQCAVQKLRNQQHSLEYGTENIAYFSSRGPAVDGRIKPDIVAPGHTILSAKSRNTAKVDVCEVEDSSETPNLERHLLGMSGTSMATPVTAGNAALVRQYYSDGFHVAGSKNTAAGFNPSAALVKATLINSGEKLLGYLPGGYMPVPLVSDNSTTTNLDSRWFEGFGRVNLDSTLMLTDSSHRLLIGRRDNDFGADPVIGTGEVHGYCVTVRGASDLKATLVWTDYPSTPAARAHLVNDIDLAVLDTAANVVYAGNIARANPNARDAINTVEQIHLKGIKRGTYKFVVRGSNVPQGPQPYALVLTGDIEWSRAACTDTDIINNTYIIVPTPSPVMPTHSPSPSSSPSPSTPEQSSLLIPLLFAILAGVLIACSMMGFVLYKVVTAQHAGVSATELISGATAPASERHTRLQD